MHYTTRVQILEEARIANAAQKPTFQSMAQAANAVKVAGEFKTVASAMDTFLRGLALSAPYLRRAELVTAKNTFPGSEPNRDQRHNVTGFAKISAISATGAGIISAARSDTASAAQDRFDRDTLREDGIRIPCNESLAQRAAKTQAPHAA